MSISHPDSIQLAGAPRVLGIGGVYFLVDTKALGVNRIWRNESGGRIYYDNGWHIGDVLNGIVVYYQETPDILGNYKEDPWLVSTENWKPTKADYAATLSLIRCSDQDITKYDTSTSEPLYKPTEDETVKAARSYYTNRYYKYANGVNPGIVTSPVFRQMRKISKGAKVDENTFYRIDSISGKPFMTCAETEDMEISS